MTRLWRRIAVVTLAAFTSVHLWVIVFIRHRAWQSAEFLDYPLGCSDMQQCARFGSNLFGQGLVRGQELITSFYSRLYGNTLAVPRLGGAMLNLQYRLNDLRKRFMWRFWASGFI